MTTTVLVNGKIPEKGYAREVDLDILYRKFPLNFCCQGYKSSQKAKEAAIATDSASRYYQVSARESYLLRIALIFGKILTKESIIPP